MENFSGRVSSFVLFLQKWRWSNDNNELYFKAVLALKKHHRALNISREDDVTVYKAVCIKQILISVGIRAQRADKQAKHRNNRLRSFSVFSDVHPFKCQIRTTRINRPFVSQIRKLLILMIVHVHCIRIVMSKYYNFLLNFYIVNKFISTDCLWIGFIDKSKNEIQVLCLLL